MLGEQGFTVVMVDLDPQANLTAAFMEDDDLAQLWESPSGASTIYNAIKPLTELGDILEPIIQKINEHLYLVPGDVALATFEDQLSAAWPASLGDANPLRYFRILTAFGMGTVA